MTHPESTGFAGRYRSAASQTRNDNLRRHAPAGPVATFAMRSESRTAASQFLVVIVANELEGCLVLDPVREEHAVEVVDLVLEDAGQVA